MLAGLTYFAAEKVTGIAALGIDPRAIVLQAGTFLILFVLIRKYALEKIVGTLDARHNKIEESLKTAEEIERRNADTQAEVKELLKGARQEADQILANAKTESTELLRAAEVAATAKAEKIAIDASAKLQADVVQAKKELKSEMITLVAHATAVVLEQKVDASTDRALIERALSKERA